MRRIRIARLERKSLKAQIRAEKRFPSRFVITPRGGDINVYEKKINEDIVISVVMTHVNRKQHLLATLRSIESSSFKNKEVIIVDDGSDGCHRILPEDLDRFDFSLKVIYTLRNSFGVNPCVLYNLGFKYSIGNTILIQNAENLHYGNVHYHASGR